MKRSETVIFFCLSFIIGIGIGILNKIDFLLIYILFLLAIILLVLFWRNINLRILFFGILFLFLGIARNGAGTGHAPVLAYNDGKVSAQGIIFSEVEVSNDKQRFTVRADLNTAETGLKPVSTTNFGEQNILVYSKLYPEYTYGDIISMECKFQSPEAFGNFRYDKYLAMKDIYYVCYYPKITITGKNRGNAVYGKILLFKNKADNIIRSYVSEPQASIMSAILLGNKYSIDSDLKDVFSRAGISHSIVISGMHIAILSFILLFVFIFLGISRKKAVWLASAFIFLYVIMIGSHTSAVKAAIMAFLVILAYNFGRLTKLLNILFLAGVIMLSVNPLMLFYDISFQFSFTALIGIFYLFPIVKRWLEKYFSVILSLPKDLVIDPVRCFLSDDVEKKNVGILRPPGARAQNDALVLRGESAKYFNYIIDIISISIAAEIALLPLIIYYFGIFSLISPLANLLVLWLVPIIMILGLVLIFSGFISFLAPLNFILGLIISFFLKYMISISSFLVSFRWASVDMKIFPLWGVIVYYVILGVAVVILQKS